MGGTWPKDSFINSVITHNEERFIRNALIYLTFDIVIFRTIVYLKWCPLLHRLIYLLIL